MLKTVCGGFLTLAGGGSAFAQSVYNPNATELVQFIEGELPILVVAPHGGSELVYSIPPRNNIARPVPNFSFYGAIYSYEICLSVLQALTELSGGRRPYMVLGLAHRRYLDLNREESDAYEAVLNAPRIYWEYHDAIRNYINRMNILYGNPLLIEITGQPDNPDLILRRTRNGSSVRRMVRRTAMAVTGKEKEIQKLELFLSRLKNEENRAALREELEEIYVRYGSQCYTSEKSLVGELKKRGYNIDPEINIANLETSSTIAGDFTLSRYGSDTGVDGADAIQLVIGADYRRTRNFDQTGYDIANAIWLSANAYGVIKR